ncbi:hypothetical protein C5B85_13005 [Pseudoclavibacter sp. AY1F1]|uniref:hypothetical protein n=1 Tax=Pseudoclavibacter sp. AY1F1 TaxID=2080583 RepID=UPI000CE8F366|nr:hypothetical protein [Pseudoclavibacter sp. AY1F1]PPF43611.1 hypothetical protein C5B85_13005 [Pseudoclavibacter sp. AY1F1]
MPERPVFAPASEPLNRRGVIKSAAWSVPVMAIAVATPAASASPCVQTYTGAVRFSAVGASPVNYVRGAGSSTTAGSANVVLPAVNGFTTTPVNVTFSSSSIVSATTGGTYARDARNFDGNNTIAPGKFAIVQTVTGTSVATETPVRGQTVDISFSRPVTGLSFRLEGITRAATYNDAVTLTTVAGTALTATSTAVGSQVQGAGTAANPWRANVENAASGVITTANSLVVTIPGTISSFRLRYNSWNGTTAAAQGQGVFLGNMTFNTTCG